MRLKKWTLAWKIQLIQEENPSVDHYDAQWNALHIGVINNLKKQVRVARVPSVDTNSALISSRRYQSMPMCFDNLINSWFMSSLFSRRTLNRSSWGILGCFLFHFGLEVCKVIRHVSPKTCKYSTNDLVIFPYESIRYRFIWAGCISKARLESLAFL